MVFIKILNLLGNLKYFHALSFYEVVLKTKVRNIIAPIRAQSQSKSALKNTFGFQIAKIKNQH